MKILQILLIIGFIIHIIFNCINFMDTYSPQSKKDFIDNRNWVISFDIALFIILYILGVFNLII